MKSILLTLTLSAIPITSALSGQLPTAAEILENGKLLSFNQAKTGLIPFKTYVAYEGLVYSCGVVMAGERHDIQCSVVEQKPTVGIEE